MPTYSSYDGALLPYRATGVGDVVVVIPGGPGRSADYLRDLGGLASVAGRRLVTFEPRGTGRSPAPDDAGAYRRENLVMDVEALRGHLGLNRISILAHSAGAEVAMLYAARHPDKVQRLVLVTPSARLLGLEPSTDEWESRLDRRREEPWFAAARRSMDEIESDGFSPERRQLMSPLLYGAWTPTAQEHAASDAVQRNTDASSGFWNGAVDHRQARAALASLPVPVRILIGELDLAPGPLHAAEIASVFPDATVAVQAAAGHFPWVDDPEAFARLATTALED